MMEYVRKMFPNTIQLNAEEQAHLYAYIQKIVSACCTVIKSNGYFCVSDNVIILMSADRTMFASIPINPLGFEYVSRIAQFIGCKATPENFLQLTDFYGKYQIYEEMFQLYLNYVENRWSAMEYKEENMTVISQFPDAVASSDVSWVSFASKSILYRMAISKCILPINKGDKVGIEIYKTNQDNIKVFRYMVYKSKIKSQMDIYTRQFVIL